MLNWVSSHRDTLDRLICDYGGIVLRGFPVSETADFGALMDLFPSFQGDYRGGVAPRMRVAGQVMEATRLDHAVKLRLHSEMAYMREYPLRIAFFSHVTAPVGGETIIADIRGLLESLPEELRERLMRHGIMTVRNYAPRSDGLDSSVAHMDLRGWNLAFSTEDVSEVETICAEKGLEPVWNDDGSLTVFNRTDATAIHPRTGQVLYRSNLHSYNIATVSEGLDQKLVEELRSRQKHPTGTVLGNGEALSLEEIRLFEQRLDERTRAWPWRNGDVMILDNLETWHGRNPYEGKRDVQVAMLA
jgi:alpha-ketoglutarate-dependent taurine dioxygenase